MDRPGGQRIIASRFVLRIKYKPDGTIDKRKTHVVAEEVGMKPEIYFHETFVTVARLASILDITTAYLNGIIKDKIFMEVPKHLEEICTLPHRENRKEGNDNQRRSKKDDGANA